MTITKPFIKTKSGRRMVKLYRILEKKRMKRDGVRHIIQNKLCSECEPKNCICKANERAFELIRLYNDK